MCSIELEVNDPLLCRLGFSLTDLVKMSGTSPILSVKGGGAPLSSGIRVTRRCTDFSVQVGKICVTSVSDLKVVKAPRSSNFT